MYDHVERESLSSQPVELWAMAYITQLEKWTFGIIESVDPERREVWLAIPGIINAIRVPFGALQSVAFREGTRILQAYGRPPAAPALLPEWAKSWVYHWMKED